MSLLPECTGIVAPYYNLALVAIVIVLFTKLCVLKKKSAYLLPWKILYLAVFIFIIEEIFTIFTFLGILSVPRIANAVFEFMIVFLFIYALLLQKQYLEGMRKK